MRLRFLSLLIPLFLSSCLTYYQQNAAFQSKFEAGQLDEAEKVLAKIKEKDLRKTLVLYKLNQGVVYSLLGDYKTSNSFFEEAYLLTEDYQKNYVNEAASFFLNPNMVVYKPEMHEKILIHYYKAINYLKLGQSDEALVECKRINIETEEYNQLYTSTKKMKDDAFAHNLMGIIYQSNGDYNNAFIAYRNAYNIYKTTYSEFFKVGPPDQLIKDLLFTAYKTGFNDEVSFYERETGRKLEVYSKNGNGEAVFFWNDGLGPVKDQFAINFVVVRGQGGVVMFQNDELGLSFPFFISDEDYKSSGLGDLNIYRVVFPKYVERPLAYTSGSLSVNNASFPLDLGMDINQVSFKSLQDRMLTEMGKSLLRFALKKALEMQIRKKDQTAGALVGIFDALVENADTRNWQTLPHSVFYTRASLPEGKQNAELLMNGPKGNKKVDLSFDIKKGTTSFYNYYSLDYMSKQ